MITFHQSLREMTSRSFYRTKSGTGVYVHFLPEDRIRLWFNDGPPMTHQEIDVGQLEHAVATGQLRDPRQQGGGD